MPNHVQNRITFECEPEQIVEILEQIKHDKYGIGTIDFEKIMPMPPEMSTPPPAKIAPPRSVALLRVNETSSAETVTSLLAQIAPP